MANEAVLVTRTEFPLSMTVSNTNGIEKGTVLVMSDPNTAAAHSAVNQNFAGIAAMEKIANDGVTSLAVYKRGRFKMTLSGSATVGDPLVLDAVANMVKSAVAIGAAGLSGSKIIGRSLETGTTGETILVEVDVVPQGAN